MKWINPFHANMLFLYPLKTSENQSFLTFSGGIERDISVKRVNGIHFFLVPWPKTFYKFIHFRNFYNFPFLILLSEKHLLETS